MSLLTDLINLNLSDTTDKIIAEYIWYQSFPLSPTLQSFFPFLAMFPSISFYCKWCYTVISHFLLDSLSSIINDISRFFSSISFKVLILIGHLCCRIGGSGMDLRSKARVINIFSVHASIMTFLVVVFWKFVDLHGTDTRWSGEWSSKASKMELWRFKHWPSSWRRQWSHLIVLSRSLSPLTACVRVCFNGTCLFGHGFTFVLVSWK